MESAVLREAMDLLERLGAATEPTPTTRACA